MPDVKPIDEIKYDFKQSKHEVVPKLPMRAMIVGPSGSGKSILLVSMILDIYRGAFERIFIWSPSVNLDSIWLPVKKYIKEGLKVDNDKEPCWWDEFNVEDLERVIETQNKIRLGPKGAKGAQISSPKRIFAFRLPKFCRPAPPPPPTHVGWPKILSGGP